DFESANIQPGQIPGQFVPVSDALPGWKCYIGTNQVGSIAYDAVAITVGPGALISIHDTNSPYLHVLEGSYSVALQPGNPPPTIFPAIAQVGTIPSGARSLRFYDQYSIPTVEFGGQQLGLVSLATTPTYGIYGVDVTAFAGQTGELRFTGGGELDNISFSS